jgi:hypothetical protein
VGSYRKKEYFLTSREVTGFKKIFRSLELNALLFAQQSKLCVGDKEARSNYENACQKTYVKTHVSEHFKLFQWPINLLHKLLNKLINQNTVYNYLTN